MAQTFHDCTRCRRRRAEKYMVPGTCIHGAWWRCVAVASCKVAAKRRPRDHPTALVPGQW